MEAAAAASGGCDMNGAPLDLIDMNSVPLELELDEDEDDGDSQPVRSYRELRNMVWRETVKIWRISAPIALATLCQFGINSTTSIFVGHIGDLELSAVSISLAVVGTFSFGFMLGMGSALETLCGQAYGAGNYEMLGVYMQRSWLILFVSCIIILPVYIFATPILILLGLDDVIADLAGEFTILTIPQLFSLALNFPSAKFLQAQSKVKVLTWISVIGLAIHVLLLWLSIFVFDWGTTGAAVAFNISSWGMGIAQVTYIFIWCKESWKGFTWLAFREIWEFVGLSFASAVMLCLEVWYIMSISILAGHLNNAVVAVDALSICLNFNGWEAMLFIGINAGISVRVSNELGSKHPRTAKHAVYVTVVQSLCIGILCMILILIFKDYFAKIFTDSEEIQHTASKLAILLGLTMVLNSVQPVFSGVAIGGGWQALVAYINVGSYYVFGLPLGYLLGYTADLGVMGLWGGMIAGTALQTLLLAVVIYKTNWTDEAALTSERMRKWGGQNLHGDGETKPLTKQHEPSYNFDI